MHTHNIHTHAPTTHGDIHTHASKEKSTQIHTNAHQLSEPFARQVFHGTGQSWDIEPGSSLGSPREETVNWALPAGQYNPAAQFGYGR